MYRWGYLLHSVSGIFLWLTVCAVTDGFEHKLYLPVELCHLGFQLRQFGFLSPYGVNYLLKLRYVLLQFGTLLLEFLQRRLDAARALMGFSTAVRGSPAKRP